MYLLKITLKTLPLTTNRLYGFNGGHRYLRPEAKANKEAMGWEARSQYKGEPLLGLLKVHIDLFLPTKRRFDIDNLKGLFDSLTGILWFDDSLIVQLQITKALDRQNPRVELSVDTLPSAP